MSKIRDALDFIGALDHLDTKLAVLDRFEGLIQTFGFQTFVLGDIANPRQPAPALTPMFESRWPQAWAQRWFEKNYMTHDPVVLETLSRTTPFFWRDIRPQHKGLAARIMDEGREFGLYDGLCVPIKRAGCLPGTVTIAGERIEMSPEDGVVLRMAAYYVHDRLSVLSGSAQQPVINLTPREREVLEWLAAGKSTPAIGQILSISEHTVRVYVKQATRKLNATTQVQAVALAIRYGLIAP